ncbi:hypothetical protein L2D08_10630 [Domibacillus sp. PGB-M46]|uniref:hypothetical protein n=1 Tax=Domibacillus sp. PGB-M46 TaxID=2910255 RepID=UPI001F5659B6|nr:hypothetical protein [Domibacillus sp. PGB-M46]MCI2254819.1 hypothetical protein [Domibacillus sp. PGB-M46]
MTKQSVKLFVNSFFTTAIVVLTIVMVYINQLDLELNEKVGSGLFYLKGYYEEGNVVTTEQGIGIVTIPLFAGLLTSLILLGIQVVRKKAK